MRVPRVGVVGIGGHGRSHVEAALAAHRAGRIRLVGVADPQPPAPGALPSTVTYDEDATALYDRNSTDIIIISTPIHTHASLALGAVAHGNDVLLEKPPTATLAEFELLRQAARDAGALVQVGFQSLSSSAVPALRAAVAAGEIGDVLRYGASAGWVRDDAYFARAPWAGRRTLGGRIVADGVLTNPLAHATATALKIAGATDVGDVADVRLDLRRVNDIEADDTSVAVLTLGDGRRVTTAVTLCARRREEPFVEVVGTTGTLRFFYALDVVQLERAGQPPHTTRYGRSDLLDGLIAAREHQVPLEAALGDTGGFMRLLDAVVAAPEPVAIGPSHWSEVEDGAGRHRVLDGVESALHDALRREATFEATDAPWGGTLP